MTNDSKEYKEYKQWFKRKWHCFPQSTYYHTSNIDGLLSMRNDSLFDDNINMQKKLKILTFEEYTNASTDELGIY